MSAAAIDHILYATPDLEQGMDEIEQLLGVRPVIGGRHKNFGTHNALLSLGPDAYLEVIARDPGLPAPAEGRLVDLAPGEASRLITWVLRVDGIDDATAAASAAGLDLGEVQPCQRETPDGDIIRWKLTDPYVGRMAGAVPFLIDWGDTPHPAGVVPAGGRLTGLSIDHPEAANVRQALGVLQSNVVVQDAPAARLTATIETRDGLKLLR